MEERKRRQMKLANLFLEMGMDVELIEKISGVSKKEFLNKEEILDVPLTLINKHSNMCVENKNSY